MGPAYQNGEIMRVETVTIRTENGPVIINEADFDAEVHTLWSDEPEPPEETGKTEPEGDGEEPEPAAEAEEVQPQDEPEPPDVPEPPSLKEMIESATDIGGLRKIASAVGFKLHHNASNVEKAREKLLEQLQAEE